MTDPKPVLKVRAEIRVERGDADTCACGGELGRDDGTWRCIDCGRVYR